MAECYYVGDRVSKVGGDYSFEGVVVAKFPKRSGVIRLVVEDDRGLLFIFNEGALRYADDAQPADGGK